MNILYANDERGTYPRSYYAASAEEPKPFAKLDGDMSCDVCIAGAGYTGLSAALHLAQKNYDVVVLDAHRVGWGASGRNGGQLGSGQRVEQPELEQIVGQPAAKALWQLGERSKQLVKDLIARHDIICDLKPGVLHADHRARYTRHSAQFVEHMCSVYGYEQISFIDKNEMREMVDSPAYYSGTLDLGAAHLHPLNFAIGLARAAKAAGVRFFENTEVGHVEQSDPARIVTACGTVSARFAVLACNGYLGALEKKIAKRVMPINNFIIATKPLSEDQAAALIRDNVAVADSKFVINYFRLSADRRLLFGGGETYGYKFPADIKEFVRKPMIEIFPQLSDIKLDYGWGGTLGITMNRMPYLERLTGNVLTASGYSGHGLGMATLAGSLIADTIDGTASGFDVMSQVPTRRFPGGMIARRPLLALAMLYYALRDRL